MVHTQNRLNLLKMLRTKTVRDLSEDEMEYLILLIEMDILKHTENEDVKG